MKNDLKNYGQMYRSGITMKQKLATDKRIAAEKRGSEVTRLKAISGKHMMGRNE